MMPYRDCGYVVRVRLLGLDNEGDGWLDHDGDVVGASNQHIFDRHTPLPAAVKHGNMMLFSVIQHNTWLVCTSHSRSEQQCVRSRWWLKLHAVLLLL